MRTRILCFIQYAGLLVAVAGHVCSLVTLFLPQWLTFSSEFLEKETFMLGLWEACVTQDPGESVCKAYINLLEISTDIQMARVLMCLAGAIGTFGFLTIIPGLTCLRYWGHLGSPFDRSMNIAGGAFFFLAGLTTLVPVSYMAHVTVQKFLTPKFTTYAPRWKCGSAMFCGWTGGSLLVMGGLFLIVSQLYDNRLSENPTSFSPKMDMRRKVHLDKEDDIICVSSKDTLKS